jgi:hypothetical protein
MKLNEKATWFGAEKFCHRRGWLFGEMQSQSAQQELARQAQGEIGL